MDKDNENNDRLITTIVFALCALVIVTCALLFSTSQLTYKPNVADKAIVATTYQSSDDAVIDDPTVQKIQALEQSNQELRYQRDIADIHADLIDRQNSWFEILIAAFGILITAIVIYFSFNFSKSAVAEAKNSVRDDFEKMQAEFDRELAIVKGKTEEVALHAGKAKKLLEGLSAGEVPKDKATRKTLRQIATEAQNKPIRERTIDDFRALISVSNMYEDWDAMERRADMMFALFEKDADDEGIGFALFARAVALGKLGKSGDAIAAYDVLIERFKDSEGPALQELVAKAMTNKAISLGNSVCAADAIAVYDVLIERFKDSDDLVLQGQVAKAMNNKAASLGKSGLASDAFHICDELIHHFEDSDDPAIQEQVAMGMYNKAFSMRALGRKEDAIASYDALIERFKSNDDPALQRQLAMAMYNKACIYALDNKVSKAIASLRDWRDNSALFNCKQIIEDDVFDKVRDRVSFKKFMRDSEYEE